MAIAYGTVVCAPTVHHRIHILERSLVAETGYEPCCGPSRVGTHIQYIVNLGIHISCPTLSYLKHRTDTLNKIQTAHCHWHSAL